MKTLEQIKKDLANREGFEDFEDILLGDINILRHSVDELLILVQKECLKNAEKSTIEQYLRPKTLNYDELGKLITNENNIIK